MPPLQTKIAEILHENFGNCYPLQNNLIPEPIISKAIEDIERLVEEEIRKKIPKLVNNVDEIYGIDFCDEFDYEEGVCGMCESCKKNKEIINNN